MAGKNGGEVRDLTELEERMVAAFREAGARGLTTTELQKAVEYDESATQFGRRRRELNKFFEFQYRRDGKTTYHVIGSPLAAPRDANPIGRKLSAQVLARANGTCAMCGKTIAEDKIRLEVDHIVPRTWGGRTELSNLQALCSTCNHGKKDYLAEIDPEVMNGLFAHKDVVKRLGEFLLRMKGRPVERWLIEAVTRHQGEAMKRLRTLRLIGWDYEVKALGKGKYLYTVTKHRPWSELKYPDAPMREITEIEKANAARNKAKK